MESLKMDASLCDLLVVWRHRGDVKNCHSQKALVIPHYSLQTIKLIGFLSLVIVFALTACCREPENTSRHQVLATAMLEAFNRHDWKKMAGFYADDADFLDPSLGKSYVKQSRADVAAKYAEMQKIFPDIRDDITDIYVAGETVIVQFTSRGTAVDGTYFELPIVSVLSFRDGLIVRDATYYDLENP